MMKKAAMLLASATAVAGCSDINSDGTVDVNDLLGVLSGFGGAGADGEDINGDGTVDVNDLLGVLSDFGGNGDCTTTAPAPAPTPAPLWCPDSPMLQCRMMCPEAVPCPAGQCNMRQGTCCASECQVFEAPAECNGCCPPGAACFAPDPPCCAAQAQPEPACTQGTDCGGQVWNDCGSSCPSICGEPGPMMCNMMCNQAYECPFGECFNEATGACEAGGGGGDGTLPPGIAAGRPFLNAAKLAPVKAVSYSVVSDWATEL